MLLGSVALAGRYKIMVDPTTLLMSLYNVECTVECQQNQFW